jgi:hypothetical protein
MCQEAEERRLNEHIGLQEGARRCRAPFFQPKLNAFELEQLSKNVARKFTPSATSGCLRRGPYFDFSEEHVVFVDYFTHIATAAAAISIICFSPSLSKQWKTTPEISAGDYAGMRQSSGSVGEGKKILCIAPGLIPPIPPRRVQCI